MTGSRLVIKRPSGWFAAGSEFEKAIEVLSDGAFKLFVYVCLRADRRTARLPARTRELAVVLRKSRETVEVLLAELKDHGVCGVDQRGSLEISERFWPYEKQKGDDAPSQRKAEFIDRVRDLLLEPPCVQTTFAAADEHLAGKLYEQGISLEQVEHAILLGCARKYVAMINHQEHLPITSLQYFAAIVDEVTQVTFPENYWEHLRRKVLQMETVWLSTKTGGKTNPSA